MKEQLVNQYFDWLVGVVRGRGWSKYTSFERLLRHLHDIEFTYLIQKDRNRAEDGINLRLRFIGLYNLNEEYALDILDGPCSVLEMMVALSIRCEENIMDDPRMGDRTGQWFRGMLVSLGLGAMTDIRFNRAEVDVIIARFLNREYEPNGKGGLFTIRRCDRDLRDAEIWYQLCWYLDSIT